MSVINNQLIDYAHPCMMAEKALKDVHNSVLKKDFDAAINQAVEAIVQARLMLNALNHQREEAQK
jgi:hypothetical protein